MKKIWCVFVSYLVFLSLSEHVHSRYLDGSRHRHHSALTSLLVHLLHPSLAVASAQRRSHPLTLKICLSRRRRSSRARRMAASQRLQAPSLISQRSSRSSRTRFRHPHQLRHLQTRTPGCSWRSLRRFDARERLSFWRRSIVSPSASLMLRDADVHYCQSYLPLQWSHC